MHTDGSSIRFGLNGAKRLIGAAGISQGSTLDDEMSAIRLLIAARATPDLASLADPACDLQSLIVR